MFFYIYRITSVPNAYLPANADRRADARQDHDDPLAQEAFYRLLVQLDRIERQLAALDARLAEIASSDR